MLPRALAIAFATLTHASNYLLTAIVGILFMIADGISFTSVKKETALVAPVSEIAKTSSR